KLDVDPALHALDIKKFDGSDILKKTIELNNSLYQPDVDKQYKEAMLPSLFYGDAQYYKFYRIEGKKKPIGFPGLELTARSGKQTGPKPNVVVLKKIKIKGAIRNVTVPDGNGGRKTHSKNPAIPSHEVDVMNKVWKQQTNIGFELVPSEPLFFD